MRLQFRLLISLFIGISMVGCQEPIIEFPQESNEDPVNVSDFRIVSYNIHGGKGPNGEGDFRSNLQSFHDLLQGESIVCMQEVEPDCWPAIKSIFSDFEYRYFVPQLSTKFGTHKEGGNAILSKFPIAAYENRLIQTDPGGDKWERKALYVRVYIGLDHHYLNLFHYHNTYNWHESNSASEKAGIERFINYVNSKQLSNSELNVLAGDMNLSKSDCDQIISNQEFPNSVYSWVDHIYSSGLMLSSGHYSTYELNLSDHQAVWSVLCNSDC